GGGRESNAPADPVDGRLTAGVHANMMCIILRATHMSRTPNSRKEDTHERIVEVAARAIRRHGYAGVGVADVMKEAGLTHGGFYAHFDSRDDLLVAAFERAGRESAETLTRALARRAPKGGVAVRAGVGAYLAPGARACGAA